MSGCWERSVSPLGSPWGSPWGPQGEKNELLQFHSKHSQKLIPSAHTLCDPGIKVLEQSDTWLWRTKFFPSGGPMGAPWGPHALGAPRGGQNQLLQFQPKHSQNLIQSAHTLCASTVKVWRKSALWLSRKNVFPRGGPHGGPKGSLPMGRKINFCSFNLNTPKT